MCKILWFKLNYFKDCFRSQKGLVNLCDRASNCSPVFKVVVNCVGLKLPTRVRSYFYSSVFAGFIESLEMTGPVQYFNFNQKFCPSQTRRTEQQRLQHSDRSRISIKFGRFRPQSKSLGCDAKNKD